MVRGGDSSGLQLSASTFYASECHDRRDRRGIGYFRCCFRCPMSILYVSEFATPWLPCSSLREGFTTIDGAFSNLGLEGLEDIEHSFETVKQND